MRIGKYELVRKLGEGGFGVVFVARDVDLGREVALKFLHAQHTASADILGRFLQEARSAATIVHPGIVTVFECGQVPDGPAFIAMELLHGESVGERMRRGRMAASAIAEVGRQVASALGAAHALGIVHRDLKPDNLYIAPDPLVPGGERVKVLDFGIAKLGAAAAPAGVHTAMAMVFGTPRYMSPEQCRSATSVDGRADIYSLGVILFELVTGRLLFDGEPGELLAKHQLAPAPTASSVDPSCPPMLDRAIAAMLAKDPAARPQTMADVQRLLAGDVGPAATVATLAPVVRGGGAPATTLGGASGVAMTAAPGRRGWWFVVVIAAVVVVGAGGMYVGTRGRGEVVSATAAPSAAAVVVRDAAAAMATDAAVVAIDARVAPSEPAPTVRPVPRPVQTKTETKPKITSPSPSPSTSPTPTTTTSTTTTPPETKPTTTTPPETKPTTTPTPETKPEPKPEPCKPVGDKVVDPFDSRPPCR